MKGTKKYKVELGVAKNTEMLGKAIGMLEGTRIKGSIWDGMSWSEFTFFALPSEVEDQKTYLEENFGVIITLQNKKI
jgi:hypothetical protein